MSLKIPGLLSGTVGEPLLVLTLPDVRSAVEVTSPGKVETADAPVFARTDDIVVTAYGGERYPITRRVFFGTYRILGKVGSHLVAERLIHVRRAWPVQSDSASFDFGDGRGTVPVERGGWLYQSDDGDFGAINRDVKHRGHVEICSEARFDSSKWQQKYYRWTMVLAALPPVLVLLALLAFAGQAAAFPSWLSPVLIFTETVLLIFGAAMVWKIRRERWQLKASVASGQELCRRFQYAVELLGDAPSSDFPGMSLWRCAQMLAVTEAAPTASVALTTKERMRDMDDLLKVEIGVTLQQLSENIRECNLRELLAAWTTGIVFGAILLVNVYLITVSHEITLELVAIWLPALISAIHSFNFRRRTTDRIGAMKEFMLQLRFVRARLYEIGSPHDMALNDDADRNANLRLLCRLVALHSQREYIFTLGTEIELPV